MEETISLVRIQPERRKRGGKKRRMKERVQSKGPLKDQERRSREK